MSKFEQLLDNILDCVTESVVDEITENEPSVINSITESVISGDISIDECKLLLESVENAEYHISILERFEEGVIDNDECIVLLEATRYEKEHTKALEALNDFKSRTGLKIDVLLRAIKNNPDSKEKYENEIKELQRDLAKREKEYSKNYGKSVDIPILTNGRLYTRLTDPFAKIAHKDGEKHPNRSFKELEHSVGLNNPKVYVKEPGRYLKAQQEK